MEPKKAFCMETLPNAAGSEVVKGAFNVCSVVIMFVLMEQSVLLLCYGAKS